MVPVAPRLKSGPSLWDWLIALLLVGDLWWTTLCLGGYLPTTMVISAPLTAALVALHFARTALEGRRWHPAGWFLVPFLAYAAFNAVRIAPARWHAWHDWLFWAHLIGIFWVALNELRDPAIRRLVRNSLLVLSAVSAALAFYQRLADPDWLMLGRTQAPQFLGRASGSFGAPNSLGAQLLLVFPMTALLAWKTRNRFRPFYIALAVLQAMALVLTISRGAWLGLILVATFWPLFGGRGGLLRRVGISAGILVACAALVAVLYGAMPTVRGRIDALARDSGERSRPILWKGAWNIFLEHRAFGSGAGTFNTLFEKFRPESFQDNPQWAHNEYLNTLSDYGVVGFVLFFGGGAAAGVGAIIARRSALARDSDRRTKTDLVAQGLTLGLAAFALQLFVDFHFKIPALGLLFATCAGMAVSRIWAVAGSASDPAPAAGRKPSPLRIIPGVASVGIIAGLFLFVIPHYHAEAIRYDLRRRVDRLARTPETPEFERELISRARIEFGRATEIDPLNSQAWADRAYMTALASRHQPEKTGEMGQEAEGYARRALELDSVSYEHWFRLGVALDMKGNWGDAGSAFTKAIGLAPKTSATWYYQAYHYSLQPAFRRDALSLVATSLRLDPTNRQAEDLRTRLTASPR